MSNARFSIIQAQAVRDDRITLAQFRTLCALGIYGDENGWCFPNLKTLGDDLGKSKQAVSKDIQALVELGYVQVKHQYRADGSQRGNLYRLIFDERGQRGVDGGSTPEVDGCQLNTVDGGSTPEVDAITSHVNDLYNDSKEVVVRPNIFQIYEQEIGALTPTISELLMDIQSDYPDGWFQKAIKEARKSATRGISINYVESIMKRWMSEGLPQDHEEQQEHKKQVKYIKMPDGSIKEVEV
jgi:DNA replication protein DnaD